MSAYFIITVITLHFLFDWILQPRDTARRKKDDIKVLTGHLIFNIAPFNIFLAFVLVGFGYVDNDSNWQLLVLNFLSHGFIDWMLPKGRNEREMINWTSVDQMLHLSILFLIINYI